MQFVTKHIRAVWWLSVAGSIGALYMALLLAVAKAYQSPIFIHETVDGLIVTTALSAFVSLTCAIAVSFFNSEARRPIFAKSWIAFCVVFAACIGLSLILRPTLGLT